MRTIICVLKSGGIYDAEWVRKLRDGVARNLTGAHRFVCLSDVEVPCERIELEDDWPGWWAKVAMFKAGVIEDRTVYLDLDTAIVGPIDDLFHIPAPFAMLENMSNPGMVGSGVMWFNGKAPYGVYEKFVRQPEAYIAHYERNAQTENGSYLGDQALIWDTLGRDVPYIQDYFPGIHSYKRTCRKGLPPDARIVVFPGSPKPTELTDPWLLEAWNGTPQHKPLTESDIA